MLCANTNVCQTGKVLCHSLFSGFSALRLLHDSIEALLARVLRFFTAVTFPALEWTPTTAEVLHIGTRGFLLLEFLTFAASLLSTIAHGLTTFVHGVLARAQFGFAVLLGLAMVFEVFPHLSLIRLGEETSQAGVDFVGGINVVLAGLE